MAELLDFTKPHVLRNRPDIRRPSRSDHLLDLDPPPHSEAYERLEFLSVLVYAYEEAHFPLAQLTTPQDVVIFMLEQKGLSQTEFAQWLGGESLMQAFLQGACSLSLPQIEQLRCTWASQRISSLALAKHLTHALRGAVKVFLHFSRRLRQIVQEGASAFERLEIDGFIVRECAPANSDRGYGSI